MGGIDDVSQSPWLSCNEPKPDAALDLFCLPYAGGAASVFRGWGRGLPSHIQVIAVELPGRGARRQEPPIREFSVLVTLLAAGLLPHVQRPYALFGHSMGALLAFELCRIIRHGQVAPPVHLFVSGHEAPRFPEKRRSHLADDALIEEIRHLKGTPREVLENRELMSLLMPTLRADFAVCESYVFRDEAPLAYPVTAFGGTDDPWASTEQFEAWRGCTRSSFSLRMFPGDHFFLHSREEEVLAAIAEEIAGARADECLQSVSHTRPSV